MISNENFNPISKVKSQAGAIAEIFINTTIIFEIIQFIANLSEVIFFNISKINHLSAVYTLQNLF